MYHTIPKCAYCGLRLKDGDPQFHDEKCDIFGRVVDERDVHVSCAVRNLDASVKRFDERWV